jgi:hypothetical protein
MWEDVCMFVYMKRFYTGFDILPTEGMTLLKTIL